MSTVSPAQTGLSTLNWTQDGVSWTTSASSLFELYFQPNLAFNNAYYGDGWASQGGVYNPSSPYNYTGSISTTIQDGIGVKYGEWLQLVSAVPLVMDSYTFACADWHNLPQNYYIVGSNDGSTWHPLQYAMMPNSPLTTNSARCSTYLSVNTTGTQSLTGTTTVSVTTTAYSNATTPYTHFRILATNVVSYGTLHQLGEWFINFHLASPIPTVSPIQSGLTSTNWTQDGVTWISSSSSLLGGGFSSYGAFNNKYNGDPIYSWGSAALYNSNSPYNYTGSVSTSIQDGIGTIYGEWLQLQSSVPLIMRSYTFAAGGWFNLPANYYIVGSNDGSTWHPVQYVLMPNSPLSGNFAKCSTSLLVNDTGTQSITGSSTVSVTTTSYSTSITPYTYFRILATNTVSNGTLFELGGWFANFSMGSSNSVVCFKEGSKILTDKGYKPIEELRKGDLVQTFVHGYKAIDMIGKRDIVHVGSEERIKDQLYICTPAKYPELLEDLVITGCHSILVDDFKEGEEQRTREINGDTYITDNMWRLPACADLRTTVYDKKGVHTIYHIALENDNYYMNYGVYASGLLVETCSKRYLKELSNMELF